MTDHSRTPHRANLDGKTYTRSPPLKKARPAQSRQGGPRCLSRDVGFTTIMGNTVWLTALLVLIPDKIRARVGAYDLFVSLIIMPVGRVAMGPLSSSIGFTPTLVAAAALESIPCVLVALVPQVRGVHRTPAGEIVVDAYAPGLANAECQARRTPSGGYWLACQLTWYGARVPFRVT
jgi:MFS family permease